MDYQTLNLPCDYSRPAQIDYGGDSIGFNVDRATNMNWDYITKELGISLYGLLLGCLISSTMACSNQDDIVVGTPIANRHHEQL